MYFELIFLVCVGGLLGKANHKLLEFVYIFLTSGGGSREDVEK